MGDVTDTRGSPRTVYHNGRMVAAADAALPFDDWGAQYGLGFFETFRTSGGRPHHWKFNRTRFERACAIAGIAVPPAFLAIDEARLREEVRLLLRENQVSDAVFRYTVTAGRPEAGVFPAPAEFLALRPLPAAAPTDGIGLRVLTLARDNGEWLPRPKSLNYTNAIAGAREVQSRSAVPSDEGLFLSRDGRFVVETPRQNLAWIEGGRICFPDPALGAVAGTCLQWLLGLGLAAEMRRASLEQLAQADAIFVLNAVRGITPVREVWDARDSARLGLFESATHPLIVKLQRTWNEALEATAAS
jgi:4-amino-4-deoxychorismate lyase